MLPAVPGPTLRGPRAFTLIEITVAMFLILLVLAVAVPSFTGQLANNRLQKSFDRFDALVAEAQRHSVAERRPYTLVWAKDGSVGLFPADQSAVERKKRGPVATLPAPGSPALRDERYSLVRDASLSSNPAEVWTFWPTGNCEPVVVRYAGGVGQWEAVYNPLSVHATLNTFVTR